MRMLWVMLCGRCSITEGPVALPAASGISPCALLSGPPGTCYDCVMMVF
jgi:hypothetical protein